MTYYGTEYDELVNLMSRNNHRKRFVVYIQLFIREMVLLC